MKRPRVKTYEKLGRNCKPTGKTKRLSEKQMFRMELATVIC